MKPCKAAIVNPVAVDVVIALGKAKVPILIAEKRGVWVQEIGAWLLTFVPPQQ
jgi:hypothetical protein